MADLATTYMGLKLRNPIIVSSSDLTKTASGIKKCHAAGAGAIVLKSLFEEQFLEEEEATGRESGIYPEAFDYLRSRGLLDYAPQQVCRLIEEVKKEIDIPLIASINCQSPKLWTRFARQLQDAGADGLELNIYFLPLDPETPGAEYENDYFKVLSEVKKAVTIPVAVKLTSQLTSIPNIAHKLAKSGCDALVLFNWFAEPEIDVKTLKIRNIIGRGNFHHSLRWVALLAGRVDCDLASSGGISQAEDIVKQILAGASAVEVCTLFYQEGFKVLKTLLGGIEAWMDKHRYSTVEDFRGELSFKKQELTFKNAGEAKAYFRSQYIKTYTRK
jgi:dihydroorotate dehydrogenase (fumarate)